MTQSQGQTLPFVGLYLPRPVFGHGQLYVGLSRVGDPSCVKVLVKDTTEQGRIDGRAGVYTVNIVYPEVLSEARRLLNISLRDRTPTSFGERTTCSGCSNDDNESPPLPMPDDDAPMPDAPMPDAVDDIDPIVSDVDATIEANILSPLRARLGHSVPRGLLTRAQAWDLAHTAEHVPSTAEEMVDPWDE